MWALVLAIPAGPARTLRRAPNRAGRAMGPGTPTSRRLGGSSRAGGAPDAQPLARRQPHVRARAGAAIGRGINGERAPSATGGWRDGGGRRPSQTTRLPHRQPRGGRGPRGSRSGLRRGDAGSHGDGARLEERDGSYVVGAASRAGFARLAVDLHVVGTSRRPAVRSCLDWTVRHAHLGGRLSAALRRVLLDS